MDCERLVSTTTGFLIHRILSIYICPQRERDLGIPRVAKLDGGQFFLLCSRSSFFASCFLQYIGNHPHPPPLSISSSMLSGLVGCGMWRQIQADILSLKAFSQIPGNNVDFVPEGSTLVTLWFHFQDARTTLLGDRICAAIKSRGWMSHLPSWGIPCSYFDKKKSPEGLWLTGLFNPFVGQILDQASTSTYYLRTALLPTTSNALKCHVFISTLHMFQEGHNCPQRFWGTKLKKASTTDLDTVVFFFPEVNDRGHSGLISPFLKAFSVEATWMEVVDYFSTPIRINPCHREGASERVWGKFPWYVRTLIFRPRCSFRSIPSSLVMPCAIPESPLFLLKPLESLFEGCHWWG